MAWQIPIVVAPDAPENTTIGGSQVIGKLAGDRIAVDDVAVFATTTSAAQADLAMDKEVRGPDGGSTVKPGQEFEYVLTASNAGPSTARNVKVADPLPGPIQFVSSPDGCTASGQDVTCPTVASLDPGNIAVFHLKVRLDAAYRGDGSDIDNVASIVSDTIDPNPDNNRNRIDKRNQITVTHVQPVTDVKGTPTTPKSVIPVTGASGIATLAKWAVLSLLVGVMLITAATRPRRRLSRILRRQ